MANDLYDATLAQITAQINNYKLHRQTATTNLDAAIAANDMQGILNGISTIQGINEAIRMLEDRKKLLKAVKDDADSTNERQKAKKLFDDIVEQYKAKGLSDDLYADVAKLKKILRMM
jgi:hypothetical protein